MQVEGQFNLQPASYTTLYDYARMKFIIIHVTGWLMAYVL